MKRTDIEVSGVDQSVLEYFDYLLRLMDLKNEKGTETRGDGRLYVEDAERSGISFWSKHAFHDGKASKVDGGMRAC